MANFQVKLLCHWSAGNVEVLAQPAGEVMEVAEGEDDIEEGAEEEGADQFDEE